VSTTAAPTQGAPPPLPEVNGEAPARPAWVEGRHTLATVTDRISEICERPQPAWWWPAFGLSSLMLAGGVFAAAYLISTGVGVWGENRTVGWAFDITNFVFWIGIGHAGTLISAILFLLRQRWRNSINRFAEAMTLFAVACAGVYPAIHVGRFWYAWYMAPVPTSNGVWQQFRSALEWDVFAVSTYGTVSLIFWYVGLVPDLATLRDRAFARGDKLRTYVYGVLALGWRGSTRHWRHYEIAYLLLAGLSTPLVLSVHTVVSFDFATSVLPGWHTTIFPPYFVAGAIFGGFAMVLQLMIPARALYKLHDFVTVAHIEVMCKIILATGSMVGYAYIIEFFIAWYSGNPAEKQSFTNRAFGPYWWAYWTMMTCNLIVPQIFWWKRARTTPWIAFLVSILVGVGMWFERFVIIVTSLAQDYLPSAWRLFFPTWVDWLQMVGDFGLFFTLTLLFVRFLPQMSIVEIKMLLPEAKPHPGHGHGPETDHHLLSRRPLLTPDEAAAAAEAHVMAEREPAPLTPAGRPFGYVARFAGPGELLRAAKAMRDLGYRTLDAFTPFPVHGMIEAIGLRRSYLPWITLAGGVIGLTVALGGQIYLSAIDYPIMIGGKEFVSLPAFVPICFELTVLFSAFATLFGLLVACGLPRLYHPTANHPGFDRVNIDGFFLSVRASDPKFDARETHALIERLGGREIELVAEEPCTP
jgi:molybdopterin-containing oxidoreductase family membrane subunit